MRRAIAPVSWFIVVQLGLLSACSSGTIERPPGSDEEGTPNEPTTQLDLHIRVVDPSGSASTPVTVVVAGIQQTTQSDGTATFPALDQGGYTVSFQDLTGNFDCRSIVLSPTQNQYEFRLPPQSGAFRVSHVEPGLGSSGNVLGSRMVLELSAPCDATTCDSSDFVVSPDLGAFRVEISSDGSEIYLYPREQLLPSVNYTVSVEGDLRDVNGFSLNKPVRWSFRTASIDTSPPQLLELIPRNGSVNVSLNQSIGLDFNEVLDDQQSLLAVDVEPPTPVDISVDGSLLIIRPVGGWEAQADYSIAVSGVADPAGNVDQVSHLLAFETGSDSFASRNEDPDWNRSADIVVFASDRSGNFDIYSIRPDGSSLSQIVASERNEREPSLSADGRVLAFQRQMPGGLWAICIVPLDSEGNAGEVLEVTAVEFNNIQPVFSKTLSNQIAFVSNRGQTSGIYFMNEDGSSQIEADPEFGLLSTQPALHPLLDGQVLFTAFTGSERDIWRKSISILDGSTVNTNLTAGRDSDEYSPAWGSDASFIAFISNFDGVPNVWMAEANGDFQRQVTSFDTPVTAISLSPVAADNSCIASVENSAGGSDLLRISLTSGDVISNLTSVTP